jgi:hypothetical protein
VLPGQQAQAAGTFAALIDVDPAMASPVVEVAKDIEEAL